MKVNNFDVMKTMSERGMKIYLAPMSNVVRMQKTKRGDEITFGCEDGMMFGINDGKYVGGMILCDKEEFNRAKAELEGAVQ